MYIRYAPQYQWFFVGEKQLAPATRTERDVVMIMDAINDVKFVVLIVHTCILKNTILFSMSSYIFAMLS